MVRIEAIIRPSRLDEVKSALDDLGVHGISVTEIKGAGKQKGYTQHYRGSEYQVNLLPKVQLIVVVSDSQQDSVIGAIESAARTGEIGDGMYGKVKIILDRFPGLPSSRLEVAERLEQLRLLENGIPIQVDAVDIDTIGVDTEADLMAVAALLAQPVL